MSLLEEFHNRYKHGPTEPAKKILFAVLGDLFGRKGVTVTFSVDSRALFFKKFYCFYA